MKPAIGVLALQGDFREHEQAIHKLGYPVKRIRTINDTDKIAGLILPGGESTAIGKLLLSTGLASWLKAKKNSRFPVYGTCAGCILIAQHVDSPYTVKLINISVKRNAYGRQLDSFEATLASRYFKQVEACFIRAPKITAAGTNVTTLLAYNNEPVLVQQDNILAGTFHPELTTSLAVHKYFAKIVQQFFNHSTDNS